MSSSRSLDPPLFRSFEQVTRPFGVSVFSFLFILVSVFGFLKQDLAM